MEDKKRLGLIITIVTVLLCGCPGLCSLAFGAMTAAGNVDVGSSSPAWVGIFTLCVGLMMIAIPVAAGIYTLMQSRKEKDIENIEDIEVPPAL